MRTAPDSFASASSRISGKAACTWCRPFRRVTPRSSSNPRLWLVTAARRITQRSRTRCRDCRSSWSSVLIGTKRIFGPTYVERGTLLRELGVEALFLGVGVDRVDYTKGILERFLAIERMLEKHPTYQGKFTFVQIGAPSRTHIKRYHDLLADVEAESERINWRFQTSRWKPIVFLKRHYRHKEIQRYYRRQISAS